MSKPIMKCGHTAQGHLNNDPEKPVCVICYGIDEGATEIAETPNLEGRKAKCAECDSVVDSSVDLPFFEHRPDQKYDKYYCGCRGWD